MACTHYKFWNNCMAEQLRLGKQTSMHILKDGDVTVLFDKQHICRLHIYIYIYIYIYICNV